MHVAIDLGENNTLVAAWKDGQLADEPALVVRLPGLVHFEPEAGADPWSRTRLQKYVAHIHREYLLPTRLVIYSAAVAIPGVPGLSIRRRLLDVLEESLGLEEALVVPRSLAQVAGFQLNRPQSLGDIMLLEVQGNEAEASFLSTYPGVTITLEGRCRGDARVIREKAAQLGFLSPGGWNFDRLYLCGDASPDSPIGSLLAGIPQRIPIQAADDLPLTAVRGLHPQSEQSLFKGNLSVIYPYQLYLAVFGPHGQVVSMTRIPFDFANLELDCNSRYKLASLATADIYGDDENQERIHFALFELSSQSRPELSEPLTALGKAVLEIDCRREDLPQRVDLVLDMGSAALLLDIPAPRVEEDYLARGGFWDLYDRDIARLKQSIDPQSDSSIFPADPALPARAPHSSLDGQIDNTLLRLQWLLNQLQRV